MKELPIRKFTTVVGYLTEAVSITLDGRIIGVYHPTVTGYTTEELKPHQPKEVPVDDINKAIEPDRVKESRGRLTKGLGDIPGQTEKRVDPQFGKSQPAPKPGKAK